MSFKIDQAFITEFNAGSFGLPVAHENAPYEPTLGTAYAELIMAQNPVDALSWADSNESSGVFRVILRYPLNTGSGTAKAKADEILDHFAIDKQITYSGQSVTILSGHREPGVPEDGWYKIVVTIRYWAYLAR